MHKRHRHLLSVVQPLVRQPGAGRLVQQWSEGDRSDHPVQPRPAEVDGTAYNQPQQVATKLQARQAANTGASEVLVDRPPISALAIGSEDCGWAAPSAMRGQPAAEKNG